MYIRLQVVSCVDCTQLHYCVRFVYNLATWFVAVACTGSLSILQRNFMQYGLQFCVVRVQCALYYYCSFCSNYITFPFLIPTVRIQLHLLQSCFRRICLHQLRVLYLAMQCAGIPSNWVGLSIKMAATGFVFILCVFVYTCTYVQVVKHTQLHTYIVQNL